MPGCVNCLNHDFFDFFESHDFFLDIALFRFDNFLESCQSALSEP